MPPRRLVVPLKQRMLAGTSLLGHFPDLPLFVETADGHYTAAEFRVDTAANVTEVGVDWALLRNVPIVGSRITLPVMHGGGMGTWTGWLGTIRVRVPTWAGIEFEWPCFFREMRPSGLPLQLGLAGVVDDVRVIADGKLTSGGQTGCLVIEEL